VQVLANGQRSLPDQDGDTYQYSVATKPMLTGASGCASSRDDSRTTILCPTDAAGSPNQPKRAVVLTLIGSSLFAPLLITVKGNICPNVTVSADGKGATCLLPNGAGTGVAVFAFHREFVSDLFTISYAQPNITQVTSDHCRQVSALSLVDCPRTGTFWIEVRGSDFGPQAPTVGYRCGFLDVTPPTVCSFLQAFLGAANTVCVGTDTHQDTRCRFSGTFAGNS
jgi:hypothetical protein